MDFVHEAVLTDSQTFASALVLALFSSFESFCGAKQSVNDLLNLRQSFERTNKTTV